MPNLNAKKNIVTALVESPVYLSDEAVSYGVSPYTLTPIDCLIFRPKQHFNNTSYSGIVLRSRLMRGVDCFGKNYEIAVQALNDDIASILNDNIDSHDYSLLTRLDNTAANIIDNSNDTFNKLKYSMGLLLIIISQLISSIFVIKLINEQRKLCGTMEILGFYSYEIMLPFIMFSSSATLIGSLLGSLIGRYVLENVFISINLKYVLVDKIKCHFSGIELLIIILITLVLSLSTTLISSAIMFKNDIHELINSSNKVVNNTGVFKEHPWFDKLSLLTQTSLNNLKSNKSHAFSMFVCILGCTLQSNYYCLSCFGNNNVRVCTAKPYVFTYYIL